MVYDHKIISRFAPEWRKVTDVEGGGTFSSLRDLLYGKKVRLRLVARDVTTKQPATVILRARSTGQDSRLNPEAPIFEPKTISQPPPPAPAQLPPPLKALKTHRPISPAASTAVSNDSNGHVRLTRSLEERLVARKLKEDKLPESQ